jgi:hypothetical protein
MKKAWRAFIIVEHRTPKEFFFQGDAIIRNRNYERYFNNAPYPKV